MLPDQPIPAESPEQAMPPEGGTTEPRPLGPVFSARHWVLYGLAAAAALAFFAWGGRFFRDTLDQYQLGQPRYAAERAIKALDAGNKEQARAEVKTLLEDRPIRSGAGLFNASVNDVWEGRVLRNRVTISERLTGKLLAAGMPDLAEAVGWKMMLEFHIASRVLEHIDLWEWMFYVSAVNKNWTAAFEIAKILAAHGVGARGPGGDATRMREPHQIEPEPVAVDPALYRDAAACFPPALFTRLCEFYLPEGITDYASAAQAMTLMRPAIKNPAVERKINAMIHRSLLKANRFSEAHAFFAKTFGQNTKAINTFWRQWPQNADPELMLERDPSLLGMMWRDRPSGTTATLSAFMDSFRAAGDPRVRVVDFSKLRIKDIGYFNPGNKIYQAPGGEYAIMSQAAAASMPVQVTGKVHRVFIAYESTAALGIHPILLVRVGDRSYAPLYCDSERPDLVYFDITLEGPATYSFEFVYLNDAAFQYPKRQVNENRDLHLFRMALVQAATEKE